MSSHLLASLIYRFSNALLSTVRVQTVGVERYHQLLAEDSPLIYCFWHGQQLGLLRAHRYRWDLNVLVSLSADGRLAAQVLTRYGMSTVRGSSSRGGAAALEELWGRLSSGQHVALTPDGPRGPRHHVAPGVVALARWSGRPIQPMAVVCRRAVHLSTWDRYMIPYPGTRMLLGYGEPLYVPARGKTGDYAGEIASRLHRLEAQLQQQIQGEPG